MVWRNLEDEDRERQRGAAIGLGATFLGFGVITGFVFLILGNMDRAVFALIPMLMGAAILAAGLWERHERRRQD